MSGRALIIVVTGIIITTSVILYNISASSTKIVDNLNNYYLRQSAQDIAQSGVNLVLRQLNNDRTWRAGYSLKGMLGGKVSVSVVDTTFAGINTAICIRSTGIEEYGTSLEKRAISTAYVYFPPVIVPDFVKALVNLNGVNQVSNNAIIDGRDHNPFSTAVNASRGTWGVYSTASTFTQSSNTLIGGTSGGTDLAPTTYPADTVVVRLNQTIPGGYPTSPDSAFGYTEGTLKALSRTGIAGSQYVTDPSALRYPLSGVTYVEMPNTVPQNRWNANDLTGTGILIIHNSAHNAIIDNANGSFSGVMLGDDISHLHGNFWGALMLLTPYPSGNVLGNGDANLYFSRQALKSAIGILKNGSQMNILAWYE
ncbi:MAG TPA: hypothetical protein VJ508_03720 [Saprospiraceae bacterium]|nr:hypothetical protein [Saprospiraceae bacterium]